MSFLSDISNASHDPKTRKGFFASMPFLVAGAIVVGSLLLFVGAAMITPFLYPLF